MALGSTRVVSVPDIMEFDAGSISLSAMKKEALVADSSIVFNTCSMYEATILRLIEENGKIRRIRHSVNGLNLLSY